MITNEVQYRATQAHAARFQEALRNLEAQIRASNRKRRQLEIAAVRSQLDDLEAEIVEYQEL